MRQVVLLLAMMAFAIPAVAYAQKMTYKEAKDLMANRKLSLPPFWVADVKDVEQRVQALKHAEVREIAKSPGGRPLYVVCYGEKEKVKHRANFNSAVGGQDPASYMDKAARKKPVVYFVGPVHGHEVEGLTGVMNLIEVMETGHDLRGRPQAELRRLADRCRLVIVPCGNPDGLARFEPRSAFGMSTNEFQFWSQGTWADNSIAFWPNSKRLHPRIGPEVGFMSCYYDDAGVNPMHDEFLGADEHRGPGDSSRGDGGGSRPGRFAA